MDRDIFSILLLSGLCSCASSLHPRQFHFIQQPKNWTEAQQYCREEHTDLATINDVQDLGEIVRVIERGISLVFVGLHRGWGWSLSDSDDHKHGEPAYRNWAGGQPVKQYCGSMGATGEWFATDCSSKLRFFCYNASTANISQRFTLASGAMTWTGAQAHCRNLYTDLARVRNQHENEALRRFANGTSVWIGLSRTSWMWSDGIYPTFTPWKWSGSLTPGGGDCALLDVNRGCHGIVEWECHRTAPFICHSDRVRKQVVKLKLFAGGSSVLMNDPAVVTSVLERINKELETRDLKASWWKPPEKKTHTTQEAPQPQEAVCVK